MSTEAVPAANRNERPQWRVTVGAIHEPPVRFNHIGSGSMRSNCPRFMVPIGHVYSSGLSSNGKAVFAFMLPEVSFTVGYGCRKAAHSYPLSSPRVMRLLQSVSLCRYSAALASTGSLQCSTPHTRTMAELHPTNPCFQSPFQIYNSIPRSGRFVKKKRAWGIAALTGKSACRDIGTERGPSGQRASRIRYFCKSNFQKVLDIAVFCVMIKNEQKQAWKQKVLQQSIVAASDVRTCGSGGDQNGML